MDAVNAVNGTEDGLTWDAIDWRAHEQAVRRLRGRIFTAVRGRDLAVARDLQKLMLRSWSNTLVSVRRVTQLNAGRATAGVDGQVALTAEARMTLARRVHATDMRAWKPRPVRRVHIPKAGSSGKLRPLGIPVLADRVLQARVVSALEPEWEARFEPRSYGFRPGRSCQDAIAALFTTCCGVGAKRLWILDADLSRAFDRIDHDRLLEALGQFPARDLIAAWLKAGVLEPGKGFAPTEEGSPQGSLCSAEHKPPWGIPLGPAMADSIAALSAVSVTFAVPVPEPVPVPFAVAKTMLVEPAAEGRQFGGEDRCRVLRLGTGNAESVVRLAAAEVGYRDGGDGRCQPETDY